MAPEVDGVLGGVTRDKGGGEQVFQLVRDDAHVKLTGKLTGVRQVRQSPAKFGQNFWPPVRLHTATRSSVRQDWES